MKKPSKALVNNIQEFSFVDNDIERLNIIKRGKDNYQVIENNQCQTAHLVKADFLNRTYTIRINSNIYDVSVQRDVDLLIEKMGYKDGSSKVADTIEAPMPGIIIGVDVKEGQKVLEGEILLILEAMKMENTIVSPKDAVIKNIYVAVGDTVDKNKLLLDFE